MSDPHALPDTPAPVLDPPEELPEPEPEEEEVPGVSVDALEFIALQAAAAADEHDNLSSHDAQWNVCVPTV